MANIDKSTNYLSEFYVFIVLYIIYICGGWRWFFLLHRTNKKENAEHQLSLLI